MSGAAHEAHDDHGHGHGSPFIQHHYDDAQHQFDSGKLGIWIFLAQEVLFFSALFVAYVLYRVHHPEIYAYAHKYLQVKFGAINTGVLIFSSLTAAWAVRCAQLNQRKGLILCIVVTIVCAFTFLSIKYLEYSHKYHEHVLFGRYFDPCVSSGNNELLTKNNECAGDKGNVDWDAAAAKPKDPASCMDIAKIDREPQTEGIQASCDVTWLKGTDASRELRDYMTEYMDATAYWAAIKAIKGPGDIKGADVLKGLPPPAPPKEGDDSRYKKQKEAYDHLQALSGTVIVERKPVATQCPEEPLADAEELAEAWGEKSPAETEKEPKYPCWQIAFQPAVCGPTKAGALVRFGDTSEHEDDGVLATCSDAPKPAAVADALADKSQQMAVGQRALTREHEMTEHQVREHELAVQIAGAPPEHTNMFFTIYFAMTGLHGIHVLFGIGVFIWLLVRSIKGHFTPDYFGPVDFAALYWHIVDLIWIFLFPLLYLIH